MEMGTCLEKEWSYVGKDISAYCTVISLVLNYSDQLMRMTNSYLNY